MNKQPKERRDWRLLVLILFVGIFLMCMAGQIAIRLSPNWSVVARMDSDLKPGSGSRKEAGFLPPVLPGILTPFGWFDTFLTPRPNSGSSGVPFVVLEPTSTPTASEPPPTSNVTETSTPPAPTSTPDNTTATATKDPNKEGGGGGNPPPTTTSEPPSPPPPVVSNNPNPPSGMLTNPPAGFNSGAPDGNGGSINNNLLDGQYFVINYSPVHVAPTPDGHYDMVYYEMANPNCGGQVCMDQVIIGITNDATGQTYYEVFNWGNGIPDTNTNLNTNNPVPALDPTEVDNQLVPTGALYQDPSSPAPPPDLQTGILIDVDTAPSNPPRDPVTGTTYDYVVVVAPPASSPNNAGDDMNLDSVQVTEVASPTPP